MWIILIYDLCFILMYFMNDLREIYERNVWGFVINKNIIYEDW